MLKALVFGSYFLLILPTGVALSKAKPVFLDVFFLLMVGGSAFLYQINLFPNPDWTGTARGFTFFSCDFLMLIVLLSLLTNPICKFELFPPGSLFYWMYFLYSLLSIFNASEKLPAFFEVWKMIVMYLFFLTCYNYLKLRGNLWPLSYLLVAVLSYVLLVALKQKYIIHMAHINAGFPHRNSMAMYVMVMTSYFLGVILNEKMKKIQWWIVAWGLAVGAVLVLFSLSRGALVFTMLSLGTTVVLSFLMNGFTRNKIMLVLVLASLLLIPVLISLPRIIHRFKEAPESSKMTRIHLVHAAVKMANANFFGVGLNNFSVHSGPFGGYNDEHYDGFKDKDFINLREAGPVVETIYLLVAGECGWIALIFLLLWFGYYYFTGFFNLYAYRGSPGFGPAVGLFGAMTGIFLQSTLEWVLKQQGNFYELMLLFAMIALLKFYRPKHRVPAV